MHLIVTDAWLARSRAIHVSGIGIAAASLALSALLVVVAITLYHWVFLKGAREGWPVIGPLVKLIVKDEFEQRDRFMRENLDAMARKVGELQAKLVQLESLGERISGLAGISPAEIRKPPSQGGPLLGSHSLSLDELLGVIGRLDAAATERSDWMTVLESGLFEQKMRRLMVPTQIPVAGGMLGSPFGWRIDPVTGHSALHSGLDFQADRGAPIVAAAGGVVVNQQVHPGYGNMLEIDHGNDLRTLYAHASAVFVKNGELVKRGQKIAEVGSTGRSTGPHLHFEVLVQGVPQDPKTFLASGGPAAPSVLASAGKSGPRAGRVPQR
jgi:murein DD-endopeptidase MepM/ murein hydrolase activator NlpD